jgi:hypothetical protein
MGSTKPQVQHQHAMPSTPVRPRSSSLDALSTCRICGEVQYYMFKTADFDRLCEDCQDDLASRYFDFPADDDE